MTDAVGRYLEVGLRLGRHAEDLVDSYYDGTDLRAITWDDPDLAIDWPIDDPIISERDRTNPRIRELFPEHYDR